MIYQVRRLLPNGQYGASGPIAFHWDEARAMLALHKDMQPDVKFELFAASTDAAGVPLSEFVQVN